MEWGWTACVNKILHSIFFAPHMDCDGKRKLIMKIFQEIKLLSEMEHVNIVHFLGLYKPQGRFPFVGVSDGKDEV